MGGCSFAARLGVVDDLDLDYYIMIGVVIGTVMIK